VTAPEKVTTPRESEGKKKEEKVMASESADKPTELQRERMFHSMVWASERVSRLKKQRRSESARTVQVCADGSLIVHAALTPSKRTSNRRGRGRGRALPRLCDFVDRALSTTATAAAAAASVNDVVVDFDEETMMALAVSMSISDQQHCTRAVSPPPPPSAAAAPAYANEATTLNEPDSLGLASPPSSVA
jgi:hypothetical protein